MIDDIGYDLKRFKEFSALEIPITFAILPDMRFSEQIYSLSNEMGFETILHLPMEPKNKKKNPGKYKISTKMSKREILRILRKYLSQFKDIKGLNNHMGSLATEDERVMKIVLTELAEREMFFLDSRTTPNSRGYITALNMGIKTIERDVFLDNIDDVEYIESQIEKLISKAGQKKAVVGIGHPHKNTLRALKNKKKRFQEEGIDLVFISAGLG